MMEMARNSGLQHGYSNCDHRQHDPIKVNSIKIHEKFISVINSLDDF